MIKKNPEASRDTLLQKNCLFFCRLICLRSGRRMMPIYRQHSRLTRSADRLRWCVELAWLIDHLVTTQHLTKWRKWSAENGEVTLIWCITYNNAPTASRLSFCYSFLCWKRGVFYPEVLRISGEHGNNRIGSVKERRVWSSGFPPITDWFFLLFNPAYFSII